MSPNPMIPPNFVTLRKLKELKEKREEEERLKREEEERLRKLKEDEEHQEWLRKLNEEDDSLKNPPKTLGSKKLHPRQRQERRLRRSANPDAQPSRGGRSGTRTNLQEQVAVNGRLDLQPPAFEELEEKKEKEKPYRHKWRARGPRRSADPDARPPRDVRSDYGVKLEPQVAADGKSALGPLNLEESEKEEEQKKQKKQKRKKNKKKPLKEKEVDMTKMALDFNGSKEVREGPESLRKEKREKMTKSTVDLDGSEETNGFGAPTNVEEKTTKVTVDVNGSGGGLYRPVRVHGSQSCPIADLEKRFSDLKMVGRNPDRNRRGRGRGSGFVRRGGRLSVSSSRGSVGGMMWVEKTKEA